MQAMHPFPSLPRLSLAAASVACWTHTTAVLCTSSSAQPQLHLLLHVTQLSTMTDALLTDCCVQPLKDSIATLSSKKHCVSTHTFASPTSDAHYRFFLHTGCAPECAHLKLLAACFFYTAVPAAAFTLQLHSHCIRVAVAGIMHSVDGCVIS